MRPGMAVAALVVAALAAAACTIVEEEEEPADTLPPDPAITTTTVAGDTTTTTAPDVDAIRLGSTPVAELTQPVAMAIRSGDRALYVAERTGAVRRIAIDTRSNGAETYTVDRGAVLDLTGDVTTEGQEQGLLGLTFSTDGARLYVAYTGTDGRQHLAEFEMSGSRASRSSGRQLLVIDDFAANHNGGQLAFGRDGFLYWGMGDGGGSGDPEDTGQDPSDLLGSLLRIDTDVDRSTSDQPYAVPDGNPFRDGGGAPEVWAYGLRNPWRFSFDRVTGDLWIGDVGQGDVEEIDFVPATSGSNAGRGANFGWSEVEGDRSFEGGEAPEGAVAPLFTYDHDDGRCSVTGGYVYRGAAIPALIGVYVFADFCEGTLHGLIQRDGELVDDGGLGVSLPNVSSFGEDEAGELYVLSLDGPIHKLVAGS